MAKRSTMVTGYTLLTMEEQGLRFISLNTISGGSIQILKMAHKRLAAFLIG